MKFNLQHLSYPIFVYAIGAFLFALTGIPDVIWGTEIMPLIGLANIYFGGIHCIIASIIGGLVYLAFRNTNISLNSERE